jgi:hypothetical protein
MDKQIRITIDLTPEQLEKLLEACDGYQDEGPHYAGWRSDCWERVGDKIRAAADAAVSAAPSMGQGVGRQAQERERP